MRVPLLLVSLLALSACGAHQRAAAASPQHAASPVGAPASGGQVSSGGGQVSAGAGATVVVSPGAADAAAELAAGLLEYGIRATFFGIPVAPPTPVVGAPGPGVVFVLDRSGSMNKAFQIPTVRLGLNKGADFLTSMGSAVYNMTQPTKLETAKAELIKAVRALPDGTQFDIIFFDTEIVGMSPGGLLTMNAALRAEAETFVTRVRPGNSTAAVPALRAAYQTHARRVVLLSDGLANTGGNADQLLYEAREMIRQGLRFDTVGLGTDQDFSLLQALARESGGMAVVR